MARGTADTSLVKQAHKRMVYTPEQIQELAKCQDPVTGPEYFLRNYYWVLHPKKGEIQFEPYDYQVDLLENYHNYRYSINMLGRQMGKALDLETPIITPTGFKKVKDIEVGDVIYGRDGKPTNVTFITEVMNDRPCYKIKFKHGEEIVADAEHLWNIVLPKQTEEITVTTLELLEHFNKLENSTQSLHIRYTDSLDFEKQDVPIDPYYLGLWLGDGGSSDRRITCTIDDYEEYKEIFASRGITISHFTLDSRSDKTGTFYIPGSSKPFKDLGVWGNKHIPDSYIFNSKEIRIALLQGLMDSDGCCEKTGVSRFYQSNEKLIDKVRLLLSTLGIKTTKSAKETGYKDAYTLCFSESDIPVFALSRKSERLEKLKDHPKNKRLYIDSIESVDSVPVRCLQVDNEDHMFLCGELLTPTHNTTLAAGYIVWMAMFEPTSQILICAHKREGASEIMTRVRQCYEGVPDFLRAGVTEYNKGSITFDNKSKIECVATTENTGRGKSLSLIYIDEFAFVPENIAPEFWVSLSSTLSTGGRCIITSTPNSDEDTFAQIWREATDTYDEHGHEIPDGIGKNGYKAYKAIWNQHPERGPGTEDPDFEKRMIAQNGEHKFRREHCCITGDSKIRIQLANGTEQTVTIEELEELLRS